jgi:hypothetical protein
MGRAIAHYSREWEVKDMHADHPYDLECRRGLELLHVEVKGSTSRGEAVLVTPNEVSHARAQHPNTELFIVSGIMVDRAATAAPEVSGGVERRVRGWGADESRLRPVGFEYRIDES